jgi:hypothetical protein
MNPTWHAVVFATTSKNNDKKENVTKYMTSFSCVVH